MTYKWFKFKKLTLSIIISYYKNIKNIKAILNALIFQTDKHFEVIVSEDDNANETKELIKKYSSKLNIKHVYHEDKGFRKNISLNKSIVLSKSDALVFVDGDCIPNKHFVYQYKKNIKEGTFLIGRRVLLNEKISNKILQLKEAYKPNLLKLLFNSKAFEDGIYLPFLKARVLKRKLCGCNWAVYKSDIVEVNGFDEDYLNAGVGEDVDIEWRLKANGVKPKSIRNLAIVYHLFHKRSYSTNKVQENYKLFEKKQKDNFIFCKNGINKKNN